MKRKNGNGAVPFVNEKNGVLVAHPLLQHSHQMAWALMSAGVLQEYFCGVPILSPDCPLSPLWKAALPKIRSVDIPRNKVKLRPVWPAATSICRRLGSPELRHDNVHRIFHAFDAICARRVYRTRPKAVVAYENSAHETFVAAKKIGAVCILDAPSIHHKEAARRIHIPSDGYLCVVNRKKDLEVELADHIITCSPMAADTYIRSGVPADKVSHLLLGAELPKRDFTRRSRPQIKFLFAGTMSERKSLDLILRAIGRINTSAPYCTLSIFGGSETQSLIDLARSTPGVSYHPHIAQDKLFDEMADSDCLLLISRFDSFGMVVAESMSVGTPVIVSTQTGAKAIIEQFPHSGWVVEPDEIAIENILRNILQNPQVLAAARNEALTASRTFTWEAYRQRAATHILQLLAETVK